MRSSGSDLSLCLQNVGSIAPHQDLVFEWAMKSTVILTETRHDRARQVAVTAVADKLNVNCVWSAPVGTQERRTGARSTRAVGTASEGVAIFSKIPVILEPDLMRKIPAHLTSRVRFARMHISPHMSLVIAVLYGYSGASSDGRAMYNKNEDLLSFVFETMETVMHYPCIIAGGL